MANRQTIDFSEPPSSRVTVVDRGSLHRVLNASHLFAIGYGDVGSSIYYALGVTTLYALGAVPLALALAGLVFFCTVLTYTELATMMPESGGSCSFARHAFNDLLSFVAGWALLLDYIVTMPPFPEFPEPRAAAWTRSCASSRPSSRWRRPARSAPPTGKRARRR
jgi:amino acid permease